MVFTKLDAHGIRIPSTREIKRSVVQDLERLKGHIGISNPRNFENEAKIHRDYIVCAVKELYLEY